MPARFLTSCLLLTACANNQTSFTNMSEEELMAYNNCFDDLRNIRIIIND